MLSHPVARELSVHSASVTIVHSGVGLWCDGNPFAQCHQTHCMSRTPHGKCPVWRPLTIQVISHLHVMWAGQHGLGKLMLCLQQHTSWQCGGCLGTWDRQSPHPEPHFFLLLRGESHPTTYGSLVNTGLCTVGSPMHGSHHHGYCYIKKQNKKPGNYSTSLSDAAYFEWFRIEWWCYASLFIGFAA